MLSGPIPRVAAGVAQAELASPSPPALQLPVEMLPGVLTYSLFLVHPSWEDSAGVREEERQGQTPSPWKWR